MIGDGELRDALAGLFLRITDRVGKATVVGLFAFVAEFQIPTLLVVWKGREGVIRDVGESLKDNICRIVCSRQTLFEFNSKGEQSTLQM